MKYFKYIALSIAVIAFSLAMFIPNFEQADTATDFDQIEIKVTKFDGSIVPESSKEPPVVSEPMPIRVHYVVKTGDTLSAIFSSWKIPYINLQEVLAADLVPLQLDTIMPGDLLELELDAQSHQLKRLVYHVSLVEQAVYTLDEQGKYVYQFDELNAEWRETLYSGTINGSFSVSANRIGLSSNQIANITYLLRDKLDFSRSLRAGDQFNVLVKHQYYQDRATGNSEVLGVSLKLARGEVEAFLADDGRFYDRNGNSLERAFNRYPVDKQYRRITSPFNPKRKHPVTGRVTPHNGTDFATPVGAPIYSIGDGKVIAVKSHPYAGNYLVVEHNSVYKTRYLHLHRFLVKKGQYVTRGQKIAISGATGRLTGPHLHFEVLVRNKAVDPMKADLPLASSVSKQDKSAFSARIAAFDQMIESHSHTDVEPEKGKV